MNWFNEFSKILLHETTHKPISARYNQKYFSDHGHSALWDTYIKETAHLSHLKKQFHVFKFIQAGYFTTETTPKCHCGNLVNHLNGKISNSCCRKCSFTSPTRISKLKDSISKSDKEVSKEKRNKTMLEKYGAAFNSQRKDIHDVWTKTKLHENIFNKLSDFAWLDNEYNTNQRTGVDIAKELGCYYGTVLDYCGKHGFTVRQRSSYSLPEKEIIEYINTLGIECDHSDWGILENRELDILIKDRNLAIEVDGLYWHSLGKGEETKENRERHISKTLKAKEKGIELIHITDYEWSEKTEIVKDLIKSKLGLNDRVNGRDCSVKEVSPKETKLFLEKYHIQGYASAKYNYGLFHNGDLVMIATFGSPRFNKKYDWELIRLSSKSGISVVGGLSKLLSYFGKNHVGSLITYCDLRFSVGNAYTKVGFKQEGISSPGYFWVVKDTPVKRYQTQSQNLKKWLSTYDPDKSESENMFAAGHKRYWDCGQLLFVLHQEEAINN